jgi:hypothetical protein
MQKSDDFRVKICKAPFFLVSYEIRELGRALVAFDYERKEHSHVAYYKAVPLQAA